ncbi:MAG: hypothetical protein INH13_25730 [Cupriavidus sp.]|nr:hypothetical protein [Cupriavidus sp.]
MTPKLLDTANIFGITDIPGVTGSPAETPKEGQIVRSGRAAPFSRAGAAKKRQELIGKFVVDVMALWEEQGESILRRAAFHDPIKFAQIVATLVPRQIEHSVNPMEELDDENLDRLINLARAVAARGGGGAVAAVGAREAAPSDDATPVALPPLPQTG